MEAKNLHSYDIHKLNLTFCLEKNKTPDIRYFHNNIEPNNSTQCPFFIETKDYSSIQKFTDLPFQQVFNSINLNNIS